MMKKLYSYTLNLIIWMFCSFQTLNAVNVPYGNHPSDGKTIMLSGVRHCYETYGNGIPLLLIHGNSTGMTG